MRFLWMCVVLFRVRCDDTTLTTTTPRGYNEYPIPSFQSPTTSSYDYGQNTNVTNMDTPLDLFKLKNIDSRRKAVDIWAWDLYCHLQPVKGICNEDLKRYYYEAQTDSCNEFQYSGCQGNKNNFETILDCERRCKGANFLGVKENRLPTVCYLQPDSGLCLAFMINYFYDVNTRSCLEFTYGGCGGNLNRFETKAECEEHCTTIVKQTTTTMTKTTKTETTINDIQINSTDSTLVDTWAWNLNCHLQPVKGTCNEDIKRYYYDSQMDTCNVFQYSGCQGNKNNFETILECEQRCKGAFFIGVEENRIPTVCYLQVDSGLCLAFINNYYYDVNTGSCLKFSYGGCGGNLNRFETQAECEEHCKFTVATTTTMTATNQQRYRN